MDAGGGGGEVVEDWDILLTNSGGGTGPLGTAPPFTAEILLVGDEGPLLSGEAESRFKDWEIKWVESLRVGTGGGGPPLLALGVELSTDAGTSVACTEALDSRVEFLLGGGGGPDFFGFGTAGGGGGAPPPRTGGGGGGGGGGGHSDDDDDGTGC